MGEIGTPAAEAAVSKLWAHVMNFNQHRFALGREMATPADVWLLDNRDAWLDDERKPDLGRISDEFVYTITGERGTGKTTFMGLVAEDGMRDGGFVIEFDFQNACELAGPSTERKRVKKLAVYLQNAVEMEVDRQQVWADYREAKIRFCFSKYTNPDLRKIKNAHAIDDMKQDELLTHPDIEAAVLKFEDKNPEYMLAMRAIQTLDLKDRRVFLLFDNVEGLSSGMRRLLFDTLKTIVLTRTILFIGIRSEHKSELKRLDQGRGHIDRELFPDGDAMMRIAKIRNDGARRLGKQILDHVILETIDKYHDAFEESIKSIERDPYRFVIYTKWFNGSVRSFLTLLSDLCTELPGRTKRSVAGIVGSRIMNEYLHDSLTKMFDSRPTTCGKYPGVPFVFLRLRVLAYLKLRASLVDLEDMYRDFMHHFGIEGPVVYEAIQHFTKNHDIGKPQVLRFDDVCEEDGTITKKVHLLGCGEAFIDEIVYHCDYLSRLYNRGPNGLSISLGSKPSYQHKQSGLTPSQLKLQQSVDVIDRIILPAFRREHPYAIRPGGDQALMRKRLESYSVMFGYTPGDWFVGRLKRYIEGYISGSDTRLREVMNEIARPVLGQLAQFGDGLDTFARSSGLVVPGES